MYSETFRICGARMCLTLKKEIHEKAMAFHDLARSHPAKFTCKKSGGKSHM